MISGIIYKATNIINSQCYVGQTYCGIERRKIEHRYSSFNNKASEHHSHFHRAIRKYGWDNFKWEVLCDNIPVQYLNEYEIFYISFEGGFLYGYNETNGGRGGHVMSEETKHKISLSKMGKNNPNYKKITSEETKQKISLANKGKIVSQQTKLKISMANMGNQSWLGKKHSQETKDKMS